MPKIEYPEAKGKTVYECFMHSRIYNFRKWCRRDMMYTVNVIEYESPYPNTPKQAAVYEGVLICPQCYKEMGYHTTKGGQSNVAVVDTTPDMFEKEEDDNG